ncbi:MAG: transporter substrate-binding domain-containing protein [Beijerinckiaceae bacterium]
MNDTIRNQLAPTGVLRAAVNLSNPLLVTGKAENGDPQGVSPEIAAAIAAALGVDCKLVTYSNPGLVADGMAKGEWDIGMIAIEPERAATIAFTAGYVQIEATYLVRADAPFRTVEEVDAPGVRIAVSGRSAYDLYLTRTLKHAELVRGSNLANATLVFGEEELPALAGLRPALMDDQKKFPGSRVLEGMFTAVAQAVGCNPANKEAGAWLSDFVEKLKADGTIQKWIDKHGVTGRLMVGDPR